MKISNTRVHSGKSKLPLNASRRLVCAREPGAVRIRCSQLAVQKNSNGNGMSANRGRKPPLKVTFGGSGIFFWWEIGAVKWLAERYDLSKITMAGASGGALAATLACCKVDPYDALDSAQRLGLEYGIWDRPLGLAGIWGEIIRKWLDELLPEDGAELCKDRVEIVLTDLPFFNLVAVSDFESREDLINVNMASVHVPFFLDGQGASQCRGNYCIDGSFQDFFTRSNSHFLTCEGKAVLFDYFDVSSWSIVQFLVEVKHKVLDAACCMDENLSYERFDFLSLKSHEETAHLMDIGYRYAAKLESDGMFDAFDTSFCETLTNQNGIGNGNGKLDGDLGSIQLIRS